MTQAESATERGRQVQQMFSRLVPRYDLANRVISMGRDQGWRRAAVKVLQPSRETVVLDLASGTGDVALMLAPQVKGVVAADFSREMLQYAAWKATRKGLAKQLQFVHADALNLPFPSSTFDGAIIAFGLRNLQDVPQGLREMARVVKPGGRVVVLEFSMPTSRLVRTLYRPYLHAVLPVLGRLVTGTVSPYRYLAHSIEKFLSLEELRHLMVSAGLADVQAQQLNLGTVAIHAGTKPKD